MLNNNFPALQLTLTLKQIYIMHNKQNKVEGGGKHFHFVNTFKNIAHFKRKNKKNKGEENDNDKKEQISFPSAGVKNPINCKIGHWKKNLKIVKISQTKPKPKGRWKKTLIKFAAILLLGFISGSAMAAIYRRTLTPVSYPAEETAFLDDTAAIIAMATGKENPTENDRKNFANLAKESGKTPLDFSPSQNYALANYKSKLATSFTARGSGKVDTLLGAQSVYTEKLYDGNKYFYTSISVGTLMIAKCSIYDTKMPSYVTTYEGTDIKNNNANWNGATKKYTVESYKDMVGTLPSELISYIISSKTILNEDSIEITKTQLNGQDVYEFTVELDKINSVILYHKQVKFTSGLASSPSFENVKMKIYIDDDWNFVRTEAVENYTVVYGIKTSCKGSITIDYTFNEPVDIPL